MAPPGEGEAAVHAERIDWLDAELSAAPGLPTLIAMYHPPLVTGVPGWDEFSLPAADRRALYAVIQRHPQVQRLVAGHVHRTIISQFGGRTLLTVPSTYVQARPNFDSGEIEWIHEPAGFAVHTVLDGELISHI